MLCTTCKTIFTQPLTLVQAETWLDRQSARFEYTITLADLEAKAAHCYGCHGILRQATKTPPLPQTSDVLNVSANFAIQTHEGGSIRLWNGVQVGERKLGTQTLHFAKAPAEGKKCDYSRLD